MAAVLWGLSMRRRARATEDQLIDAMEQRGAHDDLTGLLNPFGLRVVGGGIVNIARRDSDAVSGCMIRVLPRSAGMPADDDDVLTVAQAAQRSFRAGDAVARVEQDLVFVVGKGSGFPAGTIERRLAQQLANFNVPGEPAPQVALGAAVLNPWEDGDLLTLQRTARRDLQVREAARVVTVEADDDALDGDHGAEREATTDPEPEPGERPDRRRTDGPPEPRA